jgi:hypothetical protein
MSTELTLTTQDLDLIKSGLGLKKVSEFNFLSFIQICKTYNLDPRLRQIYAWEQGEKLVIHMAIDGWYELANRNQAFNGIESGIIYEGDKWTQTQGTYEHIAGPNFLNSSKIKGAFAVVYRRDRSIPVIKTAPLEDYFRKDSPAWSKYKTAMIEKVAIGRAIKASFSISGIYTDDEVESMKADVIQHIEPTKVIETKKQEPKPKIDVFREDVLKQFPELTNESYKWITDQSILWSKNVHNTTVGALRKNDHNVYLTMISDIVSEWKFQQTQTKPESYKFDENIIREGEYAAPSGVSNEIDSNIPR